MFKSFPAKMNLERLGSSGIIWDPILKAGFRLSKFWQVLSSEVEFEAWAFLKLEVMAVMGHVGYSGDLGKRTPE